MRPLLSVALLVSGLARAQEPLAGDTKGVYGTDDRTDESRAAECVGETCEGSISEALRRVGRATVALVKRNRLRYDADTNSWVPSGSATLGQTMGLCSTCPRIEPLFCCQSSNIHLRQAVLARRAGTDAVTGEETRFLNQPVPSSCSGTVVQWDPNTGTGAWCTSPSPAHCLVQN